MLHPAFYIVASARSGTIYVAVTSDPIKRVYEYRTAALAGFTTCYGCELLVYVELWQDMTGAITREKQLKAGARARKLALIEAEDPTWPDLYETLL